MEDSVFTALEAVNEIEDDDETFTNPVDISLCKDFIQDDFKISDCSNSNDEEEDDFYKDEVVDIVENNIIIKEEDNTTQEEPMLLTWPPLTSPRVRNNVTNTPSRKFKCIKPSMMSSTVEHDKVKTEIFNKNKDELRKLASKLKSMCSSMKDDRSVCNWNALVLETIDSLINPTFIQHLTSSINRAHSGDNKLKGYEIALFLLHYVFTKKH